MELTKEQIVKNTKKYLSTGKKFGVLPEELLTFLGGELIKAPATTKVKSYNAFEGGLIDHILRVMKKAYQINETLLPEMQVSMESLVKVVYLHQLGKVKLFIPNESQWHRENQGKMYNFNEDLVSMRVGERSAYYALNFGVKLLDEEYAAIVNYDKIDDAQAEWYNSTLGDVLKMATKLAIIEAKFLAK
tara:strand:+ start:6510 stop:7076 length:567 start_codon:yes stop_codon:yes gene_type:complete